MSTIAGTSTGVGLSVYGLDVAVEGDWPEVIEQVGRDFAWFGSTGPGNPAGDRRPSSRRASPAVRIEIQRRPPDYARYQDLGQSFVTPRNVVYSDGDHSAIDYFGIALSAYDRRRGALLIQGEDSDLVHEAAYQFLLSRIGDHLDAIRMPRIHALGVVGAQGATALFLPSGGGKSTLALRALRDDDIRLLSEDSPLLDRRGMMHPFPLRIGINPHQADELPEGHVRRLSRMEFHPKLALDLDAYMDRVERAAQPLAHIVIGERSLASSPSLEPLRRSAAVATLLREVVVGVGLYQGMEFVFQRGPGDIVGRARPALVRALCCAAGLRRAAVWRLRLGRDQERNWALLRRLLV